MGVGAPLRYLESGSGAAMATRVVCGVLLFFWSIGPIVLLTNEFVRFGSGFWENAPDDEKEYKEWIDKKVHENPVLVILAPFKKKHRRYKAVILLEAALFACCIVLNRSAMTKLVSSTIVSALFAALSCAARPYIESMENWTAIVGRVFIILGCKNSEMPEEEWRYRARAVFQGNNIQTRTGRSVYEIF